MRIARSIDRCRVPPGDIRQKELSKSETISNIFVEKEILRLQSCRKDSLELVMKFNVFVPPIDLLNAYRKDFNSYQK